MYLIILCRLSLNGESVAIGDNRGHLSILRFEDTSFPPHFQYNHLEETILTRITNDMDLFRAVESLGYFGYPQYKSQYKKRNIIKHKDFNKICKNLKKSKIIE